MITLRPYQQKFVADLSKSVAKNKRVIACAPTGSGKTKTFLAISKLALAKGKTVLILSETRKIFQQIQDEGNGIEINAKSQKTFGVLSNRLYIGMAQTLTRRPLLISQFSEMGNSLLIINDEAHIGTATKLLLQFPAALLIGFTATPDYASGKHLPVLYNDCVVSCQVSDLIESGFLTPYRHYARVSADLDKLKLKSGEFTEQSQEAAFETSAVYEGLLEDLQKIPYKKALVFCSSINHCKDMVAALENAGYKVAEVHSQCEESDYNLSSFMYGRIDVCVSVGILTKGFDMAAIDLIAIVRATTSLPLFCQMIGRGSRLCDGKDMFSVLDYGGNYGRFGLWDSDRDWQTMWKAERRKRKKDGEGVAPVKSCPECGYLMYPTVMLCPECGHFFEPEEKEVQVGDLVELTEAFNLLRGRHISSLNATDLALYARVRNKKGFAIRIARAHEQKEPGWLERFRAEMRYKEGWLHFQLQNMEKEPIDFYDLVIK